MSRRIFVGQPHREKRRPYGLEHLVLGAQRAGLLDPSDMGETTPETGNKCLAPTLRYSGCDEHPAVVPLAVLSPESELWSQSETPDPYAGVEQ